MGNCRGNLKRRPFRTDNPRIPKSVFVQKRNRNTSDQEPFQVYRETHPSHRTRHNRICEKIGSNKPDKATIYKACQDFCRRFAVIRAKPTNIFSLRFQRFRPQVRGALPPLPKDKKQFFALILPLSALIRNKRRNCLESHRVNLSWRNREVS